MYGANVTKSSVDDPGDERRTDTQSLRGSQDVGIRGCGALEWHSSSANLRRRRPVREGGRRSTGASRPLDETAGEGARRRGGHLRDEASSELAPQSRGKDRSACGSPAANPLRLRSRLDVVDRATAVAANRRAGEELAWRGRERRQVCDVFGGVPSRAAAPPRWLLALAGGGHTTRAFGAGGWTEARSSSAGCCRLPIPEPGPWSAGRRQPSPGRRSSGESVGMENCAAGMLMTAALDLVRCGSAAPRTSASTPTMLLRAVASEAVPASLFSRL